MRVRPRTEDDVEGCVAVARGLHRAHRDPHHLPGDLPEDTYGTDVSDQAGAGKPVSDVFVVAGASAGG